MVLIVLQNTSVERSARIFVRYIEENVRIVSLKKSIEDKFYCLNNSREKLTDQCFIRHGQKKNVVSRNYVATLKSEDAQYYNYALSSAILHTLSVSTVTIVLINYSTSWSSSLHWFFEDELTNSRWNWNNIHNIFFYLFAGWYPPVYFSKMYRFYRYKEITYFLLM